MDTQPVANRCPKCQTPLPSDAPQGLCPKCLFAAVATPTEADQPAGHRPAPPSLTEIAAAFPQLEILEFIGQGGMGFVFKARQPKLDRLVALKILPQSLAADPTFSERFNREAKLLARLNHPGIVTVHDFGVALCAGRAGSPLPAASADESERRARSDAPYPSLSQFYYLLMEFVDGVNLRQAMQAGRFTPNQALAIVPKICEALQFAHNEGILHRDIKPENILLDAKGRVKIADFGIAKLVGNDGRAGSPLPAAESNDTSGAHGVTRPTQTNLTEAGKTLGSPNYMAPEQLEHPGEVDHRADIYSLGVVFYEMLTGELPLGRFAPPSQKSAADPRVDEVVLRALEKERERRQHSAGEVRTQVETITATPPGRRRGDEAHSEKLETGNRKSEMSPRFSRTAIVGACLIPFALLGPAMIWWVRFPIRTEREVFGFWLAAILLTVSIAVPFGTTILGWVAVSQIRRSAGKIYGLWLAVFDGLLFPLVALDAGILAFCMVATVAITGTNSPENQARTVCMLVWVLLSLTIDWLIIRRVWRAVNPQGSAKEATPAPATPHPGKRGSLALVWGALLVGVLAMATLAIYWQARPTATHLARNMLTTTATDYVVANATHAVLDEVRPVRLDAQGAARLPDGSTEDKTIVEWAKRTGEAQESFLSFDDFKGGRVTIHQFRKAPRDTLITWEYAGGDPQDISVIIQKNLVKSGVVLTNGGGNAVLIAAVLIAVLIGVLIIRRVWRAVNPVNRAALEPTDHASPRLANWKLALLFGVVIGGGMAGERLISDYLVRRAGAPIAQEAARQAITPHLQAASLRWKTMSFEPNTVSPSDVIVRFTKLEKLREASGTNIWQPVDGLLNLRTLDGSLWQATGVRGLAHLQFKFSTGELWTNKVEVPPIPATAGNRGPRSFGPVIERILNDPDDDPRNSFLDLDTGTVFDDPVPPPTGNMSVEMRIGFTIGAMDSLLRAIRERKVDLVGDASGNSLAGCDLVAVPVANEQFDSASADTILWRQNETALTNTGQDFVSLHATNTPFAQLFHAVLGLAQDFRTLHATNTPATWLFKTREGSSGILQITGFTENPRGVKLRYKLVQDSKSAAALPSKPAWGEPVEGLAVSLQADKIDWRSDAPPILHASLRNDGEMILTSSRSDSHLQQVEVDGKWYRSRVTYYELTGTNGQQGIVSAGGALNEMQPGERWDNVQISLRQGDWQRATTNDLALATYPFRNWVITDTGIAPVMSLSSGKHTIRVAFVVNPARAIYREPPFRVISNPVEIEIQGPVEGPLPNLK
jgi:serine/threonine protein kinase